MTVGIAGSRTQVRIRSRRRGVIATAATCSQDHNDRENPPHGSIIAGTLDRMWRVLLGVLVGCGDSSPSQMTPVDAAIDVPAIYETAPFTLQLCTSGSPGGSTRLGTGTTSSKWRHPTPPALP